MNIDLRLSLGLQHGQSVSFIMYSVFISHMRNIVIELPKGHLALLSILATKCRFEKTSDC